ncbi:hypothetical protein SteCoe_2002 [Stentor coeruleus]|uniref:ubiquitinyl hydrolase 1 n=1 Tax=Stentor coeruleus TaxID=5963 RepID=A0A1R2D0N9_9CILI|nr:hypothetical protein SteCoe_2002 [Stentor coeruleus]
MERIFYYWERQGKEHTCGIHTLNAILQGPFYDKTRFRESAKKLLDKQLELSDDLKEEIIAEDGCSYELLVACLEEYGLICEPMNFKNEYDIKYKLFSFLKGMIAHKGEHFFALINYNKFWINYDSLCNDGPEIISNDELYILITTNINDQGSFFNLVDHNNLLPRVYQQTYRQLFDHQKIFNYNQLIETTQFIKATRESRHIEAQKNIRSNYKKMYGVSGDNELDIAIQMSLKEQEPKIASSTLELEEEYMIKLALEESKKEAEISKVQHTESSNQIQVCICKPNKNFMFLPFDKRKSFRNLLNLMSEKTGYENLKVYIKSQNKKYIDDLDLTLDSMLASRNDHIIFIESNINPFF